MIHYGDARELGGFIEDGSVNCIVTSPPYWGLRAYGGDPNEIGTGSLKKYVDDMAEVGDQLWSALADDGVFWLNIGDTAVGSGGAGGDYNKGGGKDGKPRYKQGPSGLKSGQWAMVPHLVAMMLQEQGWLLRADITWNKERQRREDLKHVKRTRPQSERIFMFVKQRGYKWFPDELTETGDVWSFPPSMAKSGHQAPFPAELPRRCILPCTEEGDTVLDPFSGSHVTVETAVALGRTGIGIDLYE